MTKALGALLLALLFVLLNGLLVGWILMVAVGITHSELGWPDSTIAYAPAVVLSIALTFFLSAFRSSKH